MGRILVFHRDHCLACRSCELACSVAHSESGELANPAAHSETEGGADPLVPLLRSQPARSCQSYAPNHVCIITPERLGRRGRW